MDERSVLALLTDWLPAAGDDAAVVDDIVISTDMLHRQTDFPDGVTPRTIGWRAVGASLSDIAAMGAEALAAVAAYGAPTFDRDDIESFVDGATAVCDSCGARYVGGDLDTHQELTVTSTAIGRTADPVYRHGASPGDSIYVTGSFGRTAAAVRLFERNDLERANDLFRFPPRVETGRSVAAAATAMIDSSDGLARSLHQLATASDCGISIDSDAVPVHPAIDDVTHGPTDTRELVQHFGEDFELVFTAPEDAGLDASTGVPITRIGTVTDDGIERDGNALPNQGYDHGS